MPTVVGVRLRFSKTLWFDPAGTSPAMGDAVVVETERGTEIGTVVQPPHEVEEQALPAPLKPIVRVADDEDLARVDQNKAQEREALSTFRRLVEKHRLDMKPVDVEYLLDGDRIVFYFSAEERVDFRELVRELASGFHARIDMRQVGVRDEARTVGGVGHCGQVLCCVRFGGDFQPVSIRMAKEQDLPLNPLKISGLCGRLMCCLRYEYDAYKDFKSRAPKRGAIVQTPGGAAKVAELNTPRETVRVRLEDGTSLTVPLSRMECTKGAGCPCSVSKETFEELSSRTAISRLVEASVTPAGAPAEPAPEGAPAESGRRRRRRGGTAAEGAETAPRQSAPRQSEAQPEQIAAAAAAEGQRSPRRRRRRRGGGSKTAP